MNDIRAFFLGLLFSVFFVFTTSGESEAKKNAPIPIYGMPTVIDLGSTTCIPCRMMAPILKKLEREYRGKANVIFIDVIKHPAEAQKFGIRTIPTQIFFDKNRNEVWRHEGFMNESAIVRLLELLLQTDPDQTALKAMMVRDIDGNSLRDSQLKILFAVGVLVFLVMAGLIFIKISRRLGD